MLQSGGVWRLFFADLEPSRPTLFSHSHLGSGFKHQRVANVRQDPEFLALARTLVSLAEGVRNVQSAVRLWIPQSQMFRLTHLIQNTYRRRRQSYIDFQIEVPESWCPAVFLHPPTH